MSEQLEITLNLDEKRIIIYDFETDGLMPPHRGGRPISVAVMYIEPNGEVHTYDAYIKRRDNKELPDIITEITGITTEYLAEHGRPIEDVFAELNDIFNEVPVVVVGQNILRFDNKHLNFRFNKLGFKEIPDSVCFDTGGQFKADKMGWSKFPDIPYSTMHRRAMNTPRKGLQWKVKVICDDYGIEVDEEKQHRADYDVFLTAKIFQRQCIALGIANDVITNLVLEDG